MAIKGGTVTYVPQTASLNAAGVTVSAVSPATSSSNGGISLPITGGNVNNGNLSGTINTNGGIKFTAADGRSATLTNFAVNTQNGLVTTQINGQSVQVFQVVLSTASKSTSSNQANFSGLAATLARAGAVTLNSDLAVAAFTPGVALGTFTAGVTYSC